MLKVNPIVLEKLKVAFPKKNMAEKALQKYVSNLEQKLVHARLYPERYASVTDSYSISIDVLRHTGGRVGSKKIWIQTWLERNDLALVRVYMSAEPFKKKVARIKLTELVSFVDSSGNMQPKSRSVESILADFEGITKQRFIQTYIPNLWKDFNSNADLSLYEVIEVDVKSLDHYIKWLKDKSNLLSEKEKCRRLEMALIFKHSAIFSDGVFFQKRKPSFFGRTYYSGLSIQSIRKDLRESVIGSGWQYDINTSVMAFKLGFAKACYAQSKGKSKHSFEDEFSSTLALVQDKKTTRETIRKEVFLNDTSLTLDKQTGLVKQALTAISFGAKVQAKGWLLCDGNLQRPALNAIFECQEVRQRFVDSAFIKKLTKEQNRLDKFICKEFTVRRQDLLDSPELKDSTGKLKNSKILSLVYQSTETLVMNFFRQKLKSTNHQVIANIHDAIILRGKLSNQTLRYIEDSIRFEFDNPYWSFEEDEVKGYSLDWKERDRIEADAIAEQVAQDDKLLAEANANGVYVSRWTSDWTAITTEEHALI